MEHVQIASAESAFSLDLLRNAKGNTNPYCTYTVLKNGCDDVLLNTETLQSNDETSGNYAVTIGTYPYKRLDLALTVFHKLQRKQPDLSRFKIIGNEKFINKKVRNDNRVEVLGFILDRRILYNTLRGAKYYISASRIENSSIAALEGLLLSENTVLSDIPSHREICRTLLVKEIKVDRDSTFIMVKGGQNKSVNKPPSWNEILSEKAHVAEKHLYKTNSIPPN
jgi:glycosyltransferase involved in cell wall biosynthesis